jgi:hypothetical protein
MTRDFKMESGAADVEGAVDEEDIGADNVLR